MPISDPAIRPMSAFMPVRSPAETRVGQNSTISPPMASGLGSR
jgi:hypothetical protein